MASSLGRGTEIKGTLYTNRLKSSAKQLYHKEREDADYVYTSDRCVHRFIHTYVCIDRQAYEQTEDRQINHIYIYTDTHIYIYTHTHIYMYIYMHACVCMYVYVHIHIHTS